MKANISTIYTEKEELSYLTDSEGNSQLVSRNPLKTFVIEKEDEIFISSGAITYISSVLSRADAGRVYTLTGLIDDENIISHTSKTLPSILGISKNRCYQFTCKMKSLNILIPYYGFFLLNPYVAHKKDLKITGSYKLFRDITKEVKK